MKTIARLLVLTLTAVSVWLFAPEVLACDKYGGGEGSTPRNSQDGSTKGGAPDGSTKGGSAADGSQHHQKRQEFINNYMAAVPDGTTKGARLAYRELRQLESYSQRIPGISCSAGTGSATMTCSTPDGRTRDLHALTPDLAQKYVKNVNFDGITKGGNQADTNARTPDTRPTSFASYMAANGKVGFRKKADQTAFQDQSTAPTSVASVDKIAKVKWDKIQSIRFDDSMSAAAGR